MDVMFTLGNEYLMVTLETQIGSDKIKSEQLIAETVDRFPDFTAKMTIYLENSKIFWEKIQLSISFIRALITIITKINQVNSENFKKLKNSNFDEEKTLKILISRFEEVLIRPESELIDQIRTLLGCAIQSMAAMGLDAPCIALRLGFPARLTNQLAKIQIKISIMKFKQLEQTSFGQLIFIIFSIIRNMVFDQKALKD